MKRVVHFLIDLSRSHVRGKIAVMVPGKLLENKQKIIFHPKED